MGENNEKTEAPLFILEEIMNETFQKLEENEDFDSELILKLKGFVFEDSLQKESKLITILRGESP